MIKKLDFRKLFLPALIIFGAIAVIGLFMFFVFGGKAYPEYTFGNIRPSLLLKAGFSVLFVFVLTTLYFVIRFRKKGLWLGIFGIAAAVLNSLVVFFTGVIFRASLCELTFTIIFLSVLLTYGTLMILGVCAFSGESEKKSKKNKKSEKIPFNEYCQRAFRVMLLPLALIVLALSVSLIVTLLFGIFELCLYVLPAIVSVILSVLFTLTFACKFLNNI